MYKETTKLEKVKWTGSDLRAKFLEYFMSKDHEIIDSSSVVPFSDPTLLFTNSGMVQFKKNFLAEDDGTFKSKLKRATSAQRCIRAGGKHNDLDDVGKDNYHHTFFEMLGNWSFGDYFKRDAIDFAYDFLINVLKLNKDNLYITYFGGVKGFKDDLETKNYWKQYFPENRILMFGMKDNFWEMGDTGPCGPCTEIHYDRIGNREVPHLVNKDDPDVIEIWNLVFMEFYRDSSGLTLLKKRSVDTGMGLERVLGILNNCSNYETDLFAKIFENLGIKYEDTNSKKNINLRIIADHSRTVSVCLNDDVSFSSDGRGYVLRRIIRRLIKTFNQLFKVQEQKENLGRIYNNFSKTNNNKGPIEINKKKQEIYGNINDLKLKDENISNYNYKYYLTFIIYFSGSILGFELNNIKLKEIDDEINLFEKTLEKGNEYLKKIMKNMEGNDQNVIKGKDAYILYDTCGLPIDITISIAEENDLTVEINEFENLRREAKIKNRKKVYDEFLISNNEKKIIDDMNIISTITNFEKKILKSKLIFVKMKESFYKEKFEEIYHKNEIIGVVTQESNFYGEKGGQVGDIGTITFYTENMKETGIMNVKNTIVKSNFIVHLGVVDGILSESCVLEFNVSKRDNIRKNHTATHLLNYYIKQFYPDSYQKGSLVESDKLRFDFMLHKKLSTEKIKKIEEKINKKISERIDVNVINEKYKNLKDDIITLKEEQYPEIVRIIEINKIRELCGGTHVFNTGDIDLFRIISESSISANTRRIVAVTGDKAVEADKNYEDYLDILKTNTTIDFEESVSLLNKLELQILNTKVISNKNKIMKEFMKNITNNILENSEISSKFYFDASKNLSTKENVKGFLSIKKGISSLLNKVNCISIFMKIEEKVYFICFGNKSYDYVVKNFVDYDGFIYGGKDNYYTGHYISHKKIN